MITLSYVLIGDLYEEGVWTMTEPTEFGKRLKAFRHKRGLSQDRLAQRAGITRVAILQVENGRRAYLNLPSAVKVADALGITLDELVRGDRLLRADDVETETLAAAI